MLNYNIDYHQSSEELGSLDIKFRLYKGFSLPTDFIERITQLVRDWDRLCKPIEEIEKGLERERELLEE